MPSDLRDRDRDRDYDTRDPPAKRYRRDDTVDPTNPDPSIVVHVRNLSPKATEADLLEAMSHFGPISYATCMPNKRMALVEFESLEGARSCVVYAQTNQIFVANQPALFNYSTSKMIQRVGLESELPNHVLVLTIYNAQYPVNVDVIYEICKPHGDVKRIAILRRSMLQALVEFGDAETAKKAKHAMNGADIYSGCCTLKVEFAKPDTVKVTRNDQDQHDYTGVFPPELEPPRKAPLIPDPVTPRGPPAPYDYDRAGYDRGGFSGAPYRSPPDRAAYGRGTDYDRRYEEPFPAARDPRDYRGPPSATDYYDDRSYDRGRPSSYHGRGRDPYYGRGDPRDPRGDSFRNGPGGPPPWHREGSVLMVYGISHDAVNCDILFNLLCSYGNVERVKFMKTKGDTAMVEMGSPDQVNTAIDYLQNTMLFGQRLTLRVSKQTELHEIRDPFDMPDGTPSYRDYSSSRNQRFSTPESAARNRIVKPTNILHWYNAPVSMTEDALKELFRERKAPVPTSITTFPQRSDRSSSGICEFETVDDATNALALANHTPVESPVGKLPYIVKLAFAGGRDGKEYRT